MNHRLVSSVIVVLFGAVFASQASAGLIAVYGGAHAGNAADRLNGLGYNAVHWDDAGDVTAGSLASVDTLFVHYGAAWGLVDRKNLIADWVYQGNGLIVEQPNQVGSVEIMPPGLEVSVWSDGYEGSHSGPDPQRNVELTPLGAAHPLTAGLTADDICQNMDLVLANDISSALDVLAVQTSNHDYVALAAGEYGSGRVVFETGLTAIGAYSPGSDRYMQRMVDWVSVPEPSALIAMLACGLVLSMKRTCG